jgi:hypothetical protein
MRLGPTRCAPFSDKRSTLWKTGLGPESRGAFGDRTDNLFARSASCASRHAFNEVEFAGKWFAVENRSRRALDKFVSEGP